MENTDKHSKVLLISGMLLKLSDSISSKFEKMGYDCVCLGDLTTEELECGAGFVDNDACAGALALVGQYITFLREQNYQSTVTLVVPEICKECRAVSMAAIVKTSLKRAELWDICNLLEIDNATLSSLCSCNEEKTFSASKSKATIGICGNAAMLSSKFFYELVDNCIKKEGCDSLIVPLQKVINEQDFLTPSIEYFRQQNIYTVIAIVPFGCLNGHAYARGRLRKLLQTYPDMQVYILDYDPGASDVNLINRTELVIQSMLNN